MSEKKTNYCWFGKIEKFLETPEEEWLAEMSRRHKNSSPFPLSPENIRAWKNSYRVLQHALREVDPCYQKLHIVFEYRLPKYPPKGNTVAPYYVWADAIIVSEDAAVVLEFKDRKDVIIEHARQARMYRNRLQKYHDESVGMRKWSILVPTLAENLLISRARRVTAASPDMLSQALTEQFGSEPLPKPGIREWLRSSFSMHA